MRIKPTVERLKEIAATIPISYYLGANIPIKFERGTDSYYDPNSYQIVIGMELISEILSGVDFPEGTDEEEMLRDLVYHELSPPLRRFFVRISSRPFMILSCLMESISLSL